jgi:hypothetical protein
VRSAALHEEPRSGFLVGLGGGATLRALEQTKLESIRVVELEAAVVDAVATLLPDASGLDDRRLTLSIDDARFILQVENKSYDLIVSQPSHPWVAGAGAVLTEEFFRIVQSRLNHGGIYGQWLNLFNMDIATLCSIQKTFFTVFPAGFTMMDLENGDYLLFGSNTAVSLDPARLQQRWARLQDGVLDRCCAIDDAVAVLQYFALSRRQVLEHCAHSPRNTDLNLRSEMRLATLSYERVRQRRPSEDPYRFLEEFAHFDLHPYLDGDLASILASVGSGALGAGNAPLVHRVIAGLEVVSPVLADSLSRQLSTGARRRTNAMP